MKKLLPIFALLLLISFSSCADKTGKPENLVVLVKYKTQPNKNVEALVSLKKLIEKVEKEDAFIQIKLHVDATDNSNILLYEEWSDEAYYRNQHMKTEHMKQFIVESTGFLAGPPEISYWKVNEVF